MFKSELILKRNTENNLELFNLKLVASEIQFNDLRFDTLAFDEKNNSFAIIEYKNKLDFKVLNQGEKYYNLLLDNRQIYIDRYNDVFKSDLKEDDFDFEKTKVVIIGPKFSENQLSAAKSPHYPFEIWKVSADENFMISYENTATHEIKQSQVNKKDLELTEDELLADRSEKVIELYDMIKNRVSDEFADVSKRILIDAFSYSLNGKLICKFKFNKNFLKLYFYTDEITDTAEKLEDISGKNLEGNTYYRFEIHSHEDVDYFIELFRHIYTNQRG